MQILAGSVARASDPPHSSNDYADKSLEELMDVDCTTAGRKQQKLLKTPSAVYVVTREAIERSGATNIPDLLRMVPGVQVAQVEADRWAISVRGFNGVFSNKLLVLVDNRTVYTATSSGVFWNQMFEIPLDTIDHIEVVRGPGGTVWGANAVNGVINIITKDSADTQGTRVTVGGGSSERAQSEVVFGDTIKKSATYRIFGQFRNFGARQTPNRKTGYDNWNVESGGFRLDHKVTARDSYSLNGNFLNTGGGTDLQRSLLAGTGEAEEQLLNQSFDVTGRWTHKHSDRSESSIQIYDTHYIATDTGAQDRNNSIDVDFQNHTQAGSRNDLVWGGGYRATYMELTNLLGRAAAFQHVGYYVSFQPQKLNQNIFGGFLQDEISLAHNVSLTAGTKVEHSTFAGLDYEPSVRLGWSITDSSFFWVAASQAKRVPSGLDEALKLELPAIPLTSNFNLNLAVLGNKKFQAERIHDYEAGYRIAPNEHISFDVTGFYSRYQDLESSGMLAPYLSFGNAGAMLNLPFQYQNGARASEFGAEFAAAWNVAPRWKLAGSYSWLNMEVTSPSAVTAANTAQLGRLLGSSFAPAFAGFSPVNSKGDAISPRHQSGFQSYVDLTEKLTVDGAVYYVARLPEVAVPGYVRLDAHASYKLAKFVSASLVGQNLLSARHVEMDPTSQVFATEVPRSVFGKLVWTF